MNMMSQHINSMLEHLKMGGKKSKVSNGNIEPVDQSQLYKDSNGVDEVDKISVVINDVKKTKNHVNHKDGSNCDGNGSDEKFDPRKRFSVPGGQNQNSVTVKHGNGDVQHCSANRELLPSPRNMPRKLSQDLRRGINFPMDDGFDCSKYRKPVKLKSMISHYETYDSLHTKAIEAPNQPLACNRSVCMGSVMFGANFQVAQSEIRKPDVVLEHAKNFLDQYFTSIRRPKSQAYESRLQQVQSDIDSTNSFHLTETELIYGAKLAWRNSARCIGRIQWSKLQVFDCRYVTTTSGMFEALCNHIKYGTNKGNLRSAITIFPQRTDGKHDYRIWNPQLISYAGYRSSSDGTVIGDPQNAEFPEVCLKLGWKGKGTAWDILPLVLSANGHDPDYFDLPPDLILQVPLSHPTYEWFADLQLRWYALPAVSNMLFDCGGIIFTATAFSGWYMSTEIGCRNLCDVNGRNMLEKVALKLELDTRTSTSLWKDKALVEINLAVLHSFQSHNVTIVDHHTASESFMKHLENETKLRNGCMADWVWIVPPMSASVLPVFHQEMVVYSLKPSFDYQEAAHKVHVWKKDRDKSKSRKPRRKFNFKQIARAVKFTSKLFGRALSRRIKATVLYATETGKSEQYAKQLVELLGHAFNAQIYCMSDYDISSIEHEALLLVIASTFGNCDPPENGEEFAQGLYAMKLRQNEENTTDNHRSIAVSSKSFMKANSKNDFTKSLQHVRKFDRLESLRGSTTTDSYSEETFGPLSNVRFAVFALGSSAYPNFCAYGKYVDNVLGELGGERLTKVAYGDEMCGQEQAFRKWAPEVFKIACETFCLDTDDTFSSATLALQGESLTRDTVRLVPVNDNTSLERQISKYHNKKAVVCKIKSKPRNLHGNTKNSSGKSTILVEIIADDVDYEPGDHVGIYPTNSSVIVNGILNRLCGVDNHDEILQLQILKETHSTNGIEKSWEPHERLPACSLKTLLTRFLDLTTPPSRQLLTLLASFCDDKEDEDRMYLLANESSAYEDWRHHFQPHLLEVLEEFPSCHPPASLLIAHLMPLHARFYSISSSPRKTRNEVNLTVDVVKYKTQDGEGAEHYGVCSNYLEGLDRDDVIYLSVRNASSFHLPADSSKPIILIGPGTGIAPFRSFWQHWDVLRSEDPDAILPKVWLFFGCRTKSLDLYCDEKEELLDRGILDKVFLALSREPNTPKTYVQDLAANEAESIYRILVKEGGHVYVCGDVTMAEHVYQTLRKIIATNESKTESEVEKYLLSLRDQSRYHEDIFGITLRTAEIHNKSRATARIRMASQPLDAVMFRLSFFFSLSIGIVLVCTSLAQQTIRPFWGYNCVDSECIRVQANSSNPNALGLHACFLSCYEFGTLWPRPRNVVSWNNTLLNLNRSNVQLRRAVPEEHSLYWEQSMERFNRIIDARVGQNEVVEGEFALVIDIDVENDSLELSLDTNEQYELELSSTDSNELVARIRALTYYGARHGLETLSQLIAFDEFTSQLKVLSGVSIRDEPTYRHRGILVDTARRFYPVDVLKRTIDVMAMTKLNVFHWHITDSQSFAMVLLSHPELSQKGAYSPQKVYYPRDIREIVEYGRVRGVRIIPELDAPSHVAEGFQDSNLVTCLHAQPWGRFCAGPPCGQFDVTKPELYELLYELYSEMNDMFGYPSQFHMGGDEIFYSCWNSSSEVRQFMIDRGWGLTEEDYLNLWGYFQERALNVYRYVTDYAADKKPILWTSSLTEEDVIDEYLNPDDYIIQIWTTARGSDSQISHLLEKGYDVIISNHDVLYLDCGFGNWVGSGNNWCSPFSPWHLIYDNNFRDMAGNRTSQVLGGEVCSWSEPTDDVTLDSKLWPRASAFGERLWSDPDTDFRADEYRILLHREFLVQYGIHAESIQPEWCVQNLGECPWNY